MKRIEPAAFRLVSAVPQPTVPPRTASERRVYPVCNFRLRNTVVVSERSITEKKIYLYASRRPRQLKDYICIHLEKT